MVFSSSLFLFGFFPVFFISYFLVPNRLKNSVIILFSLFFYAWGAPMFCVITVGTLVIDWILGMGIYRAKFEKRNRPLYRLLVALDVLMNVGLLVYFKYTNFIVDNLNVLLEGLGGSALIVGRVLLPVGVSFVIFQKMTYCLDVANGTCKPARNYFHVLTYLLVFPQVVAGPIVQYGELAEQIRHRVLTWEDFIYGLERFSLGLFKKVWIADVLAYFADNVFSAGAVIPFDYAWIGAMAYTFQIFFDFSGYSDMAIGMLSMMGFHIGENFNAPYIARSFNEFWKRWHISMTSWFRSYLYLPLGGNRKGMVRTYVNHWIVFLISGFWHGAAWNYVVWGAYHGAFICLEKLLKVQKWRLPGFVRWLCTFVLVVIGWVIFRAETLSDAFIYIGNMFNFGNYYVHINPEHIMVIDNVSLFIFILAAVMCATPFLGARYAAVKRFMREKARSPLAIGAFLLLLLSALKVATGDISPFIYFMF